MLTKTRTTIIAGLAAVAALTTTGVASAAIGQRTTISPVVAGSTNVTTADKASNTAGGKGSAKKQGLTCDQALLVGDVYLGLARTQRAAGQLLPLVLYRRRKGTPPVLEQR